jgi:hypothetical protein
MKKTLERLLEAHVRHELARFKGSRLRKAVEQEVNAAFEWIQEVRLVDLVTPETVLSVIRRDVVELPLSGGAAELAGEMSRRVLSSRHNRKTTLEDIFARKPFDDIVDKAVGLRNARSRLIHLSVHTAAYTGLISDVLYTLIRDYMLKGTLLARRMPGVHSLSRLGREAVNKAMPDLELAVETRIKEFIQFNLKKTLALSERFLLEFLEGDRIVEIADQIWDSVARVPLSEHFGTLDADDMEDFIIIGIEFWEHFRKTSYFRGIYTEIVRAFFQKYGKKEVSVILEDVGVTRQMVVEEIMQVVSPGVRKALETGYLEQRIRERLADFYSSKKVSSLV